MFSGLGFSRDACAVTCSAFTITSDERARIRQSAEDRRCV